MRENKLTIIINKPIAAVFDFTTDPKNTPKWIDFIAREETNERPVRVGTIYRNQNQAGPWNEYIVTEYELNKSFTFSRKNSTYHVRYIFRSKGGNTTELEYHEWVDHGELDEPFGQEYLDKLKSVMEAEPV